MASTIYPVLEHTSNKPDIDIIFNLISRFDLSLRTYITMEIPIYCAPLSGNMKYDTNVFILFKSVPSLFLLFCEIFRSMVFVILVKDKK